jgi:hypothetical protein
MMQSLALRVAVYSSRPAGQGHLSALRAALGAQRQQDSAPSGNARLQSHWQHLQMLQVLLLLLLVQQVLAACRPGVLHLLQPGVQQQLQQQRA